MANDTQPTAVNSQITDAITQAAVPAVNDQITDAVTQSNVKVVGEAPAYAMGTIYQALAHSTGILFQNAVSQQQQQNILAQAAATQGVMLIYTLDTAAEARAAEGSTGFTPAQLSARAVDAAASTQANGSSKVLGSVNDQITQAVKLALDTTLSHSGDVAYGVRAAADALASAIERVNRASQENLLQTIKNSAIAACLAGMISEPDKADAYEDVIDVIRKLGSY